MIVEVVGMPGSGKSTVTRMLMDRFPESVGKYDKAVKRLIDKTSLKERFEEQYPGAWEAYEETLSYFTVDNTPESPEEWRKKAFDKHTDQMALHLALKGTDKLFIWNKGITQVALEVLQGSKLSPESSEFNTIAESLVKVWPVTSMVVEIRVNEEFGRLRYIGRRVAKMARKGPRGEKSRKYPGWSPDLYDRNWRMWDKYMPRLLSRCPYWKELPNNLLKLEDLEQSPSFETAVRQIKCISTL